MAIAATLLIAIPMIWVQAAMYFHARNVATAGARQGVEAARVSSGTDAAGQTTAQDFVDQASGPLTNATATVDRSTDRVTVTVSGDVATVIPGMEDILEVNVSVDGPIERFEP